MKPQVKQFIALTQTWGKIQLHKSFFFLNVALTAACSLWVAQGLMAPKPGPLIWLGLIGLATWLPANIYSTYRRDKQKPEIIALSEVLQRESQEFKEIMAIKKTKELLSRSIPATPATPDVSHVAHVSTAPTSTQDLTATAKRYKHKI